jgi:hypothetical protein
MEHIFFNLEGTLAEVAKRVFVAIGLSTYVEGDSANALGGSYFTISILGTAIRLEENSYDYEDKYRFMMAFKKDPCSSVVLTDQAVRAFALIVAQILTDNAKTVVAMETEGGMRDFAPNE